jgi:hypothetical protein
LITPRVSSVDLPFTGVRPANHIFQAGRGRVPGRPSCGRLTIPSGLVRTGACRAGHCAVLDAFKSAAMSRSTSRRSTRFGFASTGVEVTTTNRLPPVCCVLPARNRSLLRVGELSRTPAAPLFTQTFRVAWRASWECTLRRDAGWLRNKRKRRDSSGIFHTHQTSNAYPEAARVARASVASRPALARGCV